MDLNMTATQKRFLAAAALVGMTSATLRAADNDESPQPADRTLETCRQELTVKLREAWQWPEALDHPQQIGTNAEKVIPLVESLAALEQRAAEQEPDRAAGPLGVRDQLLALASLLGDKKAIEELAASVRSADSAERSAAEAADLLSQWWRAGRDANVQSKILDRMYDLLRGSGTASDRVTGVILAMSERAATPAIADRAETVIVSVNPPGPRAQAVLTAWDAKLRAQRNAQLHGQEGNPITLSGTTFEGRPLSTADWKGHVILVDFWATWCGPCVQSLPDLNQVYTKYHDRGLEVLGVCCDSEHEAVQKFRAGHLFMRWPDLFEAGHAGLSHPLADACGVDGIPTYFLIDKRGIVRKFASGGGTLSKDDFRKRIEQFLNEP